MFERLIDILENIWWWLVPFEVIDEYELGLVLRWGRYHRTLAPGFHWTIPFGVERVMKDTVVRTTSYLDAQSLQSLDGKPVVISAILIYKIGNIKRWLLEVDDAETALHDITYGLIDEAVSRTPYADILDHQFDEKIFQTVKEAGVSWGARVEAVKFSDRTSAMSIRLWTTE